jgi:hypothetical protein
MKKRGTGNATTVLSYVSGSTLQEEPMMPGMSGIAEQPDSGGITDGKIPPASTFRRDNPRGL